MVTAEIVTGH